MAAKKKEAKKRPKPIEIGPDESALAKARAPQGDASLAEMEETFKDTTGAPSSALEALTLYNQGKEDYWKFGEDNKRDEVFGIFLYSARPMRAFWPVEDDMDGSAPVCFSIDGIEPRPEGEAVQSATCKECQWNKLGTAKQGKGKACKTKAADFIIEVPKEVEMGETGALKGKALVDPERVLGPAVLRYSISNREAPAEFVAYCKEAKEVGEVPYPQAILGRWGWQKCKSKSGVAYHAVKMECVGPLSGPDEDPPLWNMIARETRLLKQGAAQEILLLLSGSTGQ